MRPTSLRRFGLTVGGVFLVLGALSAWRGHAVFPAVALAAGVPLVLLALAAPTLLAPVERRWMAAAEVLGRVNTRIILTALYVLVLTPAGALRRAHLRATAHGRPVTTSDWVRRRDGGADLARYRRQF